jgi:nitrogen fixation protein FixH
MAAITAGTWKRFPNYMALAMGAVVLVNAWFIYAAVTTFPGEAGSDDFGTSNRYNAVLAIAASQAALGWSTEATAPAMRPTLIVTGANHAPLAGATITAQAERPIGTAAAVKLEFHETMPGRYIAQQTLPAPGQWDLMLRIAHGNQNIRITRRVIGK